MFFVGVDIFVEIVIVYVLGLIFLRSFVNDSYSFEGNEINY